MKRSFALIAPYAAWMLLMQLLPSTAMGYAIRGAVTSALLALNFRRKVPTRGILAGVGVGLLVLVVWIAPEAWLFTSSAAESSPYAPSVCGWPLTLARLAASAFVISAAEELFFRKWLVEFAGFGWMLVLFGVEHMRFDLGLAKGSAFVAEGVFAGLCYGLVAKKYGIVAAIVAHAVTNLILGLYVIFADKWFYWC